MIYSTSTAGTGGEIKKELEDFIVEEIGENSIRSIKYSAKEKKNDSIAQSPLKYLECDLVKNDWETPRAIKFIAKRLGMSEKRIRHAGLKDKKAITCQRISIERTTIENVKRVKLKDIVLKNFRYTDERLSIGDLKGNKFTIVVRNCDLKGKELEDTVKGTISQIKKKGVYNLYGEQRFSRANVKIAEEILKGDYENAIKILLTAPGDRENEESKNARLKMKENWKNWNECIKDLPKRFWVESAILNHLVKNQNDFIGAFRKIRKTTRKIIINAYQSYVFNRMIEEFKDEFEELPLVGYDSEIKNEKIKNFLEKENVKPENLKIKSMPEMSCMGGTRKTRMFVEKLRLKKIGEDEFTITFELPKGSYATLIAEEFIKHEKQN